MTRWSELPLWAWALGLRNGVNFRASPDSSRMASSAPLPTPCTGPTAIDEAQVITSAVEYPDVTGWHKPVLDIDFPAQLIPSSTEGHFHLYLDKELPWDKYKALLTALAEAGIIERGYANASIARGYTAVRLPWVHRDDDPVEEPEAATEAPVPAEPVVRYDPSRHQYLIGDVDRDGLVLTNEFLRQNPLLPSRVADRLRALGIDNWPAARDDAARRAGAPWMQPHIHPESLAAQWGDGEEVRPNPVTRPEPAGRVHYSAIIDGAIANAAISNGSIGHVWNGNADTLTRDMMALGERVRAGLDHASESMRGLSSSISVATPWSSPDADPLGDIAAARDAIAAASASEWTLRA